MAEQTEPAALPAEDAGRLTDFARACKAAARAVVLYPAGHPAITATLGRIVQITSPAVLPRPLRLTVLPDSLLLDGMAPSRPDGSLHELATLLHDHLVGEITIHPGGDTDAWRNFLLLLARSPEEIRAEGGVSRVWTMTAGRHVELREIDYSEVLRERAANIPAAWDQIVANCLQGASDLAAEDEGALRALVDAASDAGQLTDLVATLQTRAGEGRASVGVRTAALLRLLRKVVEAVSSRAPDQLDASLANMAAAAGQLSPEMMMAMLSHRGDEGDLAPGLVDAVVSHMSDGTIAGFVSRAVVANESPIDRIAQVFQTLVPDADQRPRLLSLARAEVATSEIGEAEGFEEVWDHVAQKLLTSYSDKPFVSDEYARELSAARATAVQVEQVSDDPPERMSGWLGTVATTALRSLDLTLLLDLLRLEEDPQRWADLMSPVATLIEDLLLVGDFESASRLLEVIAREAGPAQSTDRRQYAMIAMDLLVKGAMLRHISAHLPTIDDVQFERVKAMCVSVGEALVRPLAEALSTEERGRTRERLTTILIAFGAVGRRTVERLKSSPNAAVRRTAIYLLREFGGKDALPDLTDLLDDSEPQVQREAVRAILNIGTERAYIVLEQALVSGTSRSRDAIMQALGGVRDEGATPLFAHIVRHVDHRGPLAPIYLRAIELLGMLRDPEAVEPLKEALYRGEWWAPWRTSAFRRAAAAALARIGDARATAVLDEAARTGSRGVRAAARAPGSSPRARGSRDAGQ